MNKTDEVIDKTSSRENFPKYRELKVLETVMEPPAKAHNVGLCYVPINLEPCIILRGKWLKKAGFKIGQTVAITIERNELYITHRDSEQIGHPS